VEIEEGITLYLLSYDGITALIKRRFFYEEMPQGTPLPAVVCIKISDIKEHTLTAQSNLERPIFQFSVFAKTKAEARVVANRLKAALCDYQGCMGGIEVQKIELQTELSGLEKMTGGASKVYFDDLEFQFFYIREE
jgi:hypothetical protein